ncbi:MAG: tetratricopeptide repeat protein [bacterium]
MMNLLSNNNDVKLRPVKKIFNIEAEKLVREASDNFIYFRDYEKTIEQLTRVLEIEPNHVKALILKGNIFFCIDKDNEALECFEKALSLDPFSAEAHGSKANTLDVLGKVKEAFACCEKAFKNITAKDKDLLPSLYDQKIALLIKLKKYEDAKQTLKQCYRYLKTEDSFKIASCYRDIIDTLLKEQRYRKKIATERFKIIHSI